MYFSRIIFLSLFVLTACQKAKIPKNGLYTQFKPSNNRSIASADLDQFVKFQDPMQVFFYCQKAIKSDVSKCYNRIISQKVLHYKGDNKQALKKQLEMKNIQQKVDSITKSIISSHEGQLSMQLKKRAAYCAQNATSYFSKCLKMYLDKESVDLVNKIQNNYKSLNGHEYLYLKSEVSAIIRTHFKALDFKFKKQQDSLKNNITL